MSRNRRAGRWSLLLGSTAAIVCGFGAAQAHAQDQEENTLPDLVVTAERRVQNLQDVPIAATVLTGDQLIERGVNAIADIQGVAPSITINTYNRSTFINIRGIGIAQSAPTSTPGVAYYINGGFIPHEQTIGMSFYDLESVQVLRGPQGTLTGQNSTGGAVYVTTPKPKFENVSGYIDGQVTDYNGVKAVAALNLPIFDWAAVRVAGVREVRDSFTTNVGSPSQPGDVDVTAWRADVLVKPFDKLSTNLRFEKFMNDTDYNAVKRRNDTAHPDPFVIAEDAISHFVQDGYRSEVETRWDFIDFAQLRLDVNYQYGLNWDIADGDRTNTAPTTAAGANRGRLGFTQTIFNTLISEVDVISTNEGPVDWVVGGFYLTEDVPVKLLTYGNDRVIPTNPPTSTTRTHAHNLSRSVFGQANWQFNDQWEFIAGARYSKDTQFYERIQTAGPTGVARSDVTTGRVAVNYKYNDTTMFYGSVAKGYKAGGVNLVAGDPAFKPETNVVGELGVKTTVMEGRLRINADVFTSQYDDLQLSSLTPARLPSTHNVDKSKSSGAEIEADAIVGAWRLNAGLAYLDSKTDSVASILDNTVSPSVLKTVPTGSRLPWAPQWTGNAGVEYGFDLGGGTVTPRLQVSYQSEQWGSIFQNANSLIPARTLLDARISYDTGKAWRAELFVNNLTDETYVASQVQDASSTNGGYIYGARRLVGARFVVRMD